MSYSTSSTNLGQAKRRKKSNRTSEASSPNLKHIRGSDLGDGNIQCLSKGFLVDKYTNGDPHSASSGDKNKKACDDEDSIYYKNSKFYSEGENCTQSGCYSEIDFDVARSNSYCSCTTKEDICDCNSCCKIHCQDYQDSLPRSYKCEEVEQFIYEPICNNKKRHKDIFELVQNLPTCKNIQNNCCCTCCSNYTCSCCNCCCSCSCCKCTCSYCCNCGCSCSCSNCCQCFCHAEQQNDKNPAQYPNRNNQNIQQIQKNQAEHNNDQSNFANNPNRNNQDVLENQNAHSDYYSGRNSREIVDHREDQHIQTPVFHKEFKNGDLKYYIHLDTVLPGHGLKIYKSRLPSYAKPKINYLQCTVGNGKINFRWEPPHFSPVKYGCKDYISDLPFNYRSLYGLHLYERCQMEK